MPRCPALRTGAGLTMVSQLSPSLVPRPHPQNGKGSGFLGFAVSAERTRLHTVQYVLYHMMPRGCHMTADTAQPRKRLNVTRPFPILWVGSGDETNSPHTSKYPKMCTHDIKQRHGIKQLHGIKCTKATWCTQNVTST